MSQPHPPPVFELGLTMAGAISAGAYTAGVVDFLAEALSQWELARQHDPGRVPNHRVALKAMSGASAGAIAGGLSVLALADGLMPTPASPATSPTTSPTGARYNPNQYLLPKIYDTWVTRPTMLPSGPTGALLGLEDLADGAEVRSLLDTTLLDRARDAALQLPPTVNQVAKLPFVARQLHVYMTVANLHGVPYDVEFQSVDGRGNPAPAQHTMMMHGDRLHFCVTGLGSMQVTPSPWGDADQPIRLDVNALIGAGGAPADWVLYGNAALASSAFPVGLRPRILHNTPASYVARRWPMSMPANVKIAPNPSWQLNSPAYVFSNVDGGTINNEPFEIARWTLLADPYVLDPHNPSHGNDVDRAVIMIDPFPEGPAFDFNAPQSDFLKWVAGKILPLFIDQSRFKPEELAAASDEGRYSRYLIAPSRAEKDASGKERQIDGANAIACGLLGGFGGFFDVKFRAHDYQLGRRNCQWFLRHSFAIPAGNPMVDQWSAPAKANAQFQTSSGGVTYYQLIPLLGTANLEVPQPQWHKMDRTSFDTLRAAIKIRADAVFDRLLPSIVGNGLARLAIKAAWCLWGRGTLIDFAMGKLTADLDRRKQ